MSHDSTHAPAERPTQAIFIGIMSVVLIGVMAVATAVMLISGATAPHH